MVELKEFNVFDYLTTMEDYKEYIKVLHQEMEKMEYERQPLPEWSTLLAEKDAEIKRLRTTLRLVADWTDWTDYSNETKWTMANALHNANVIVRAALEEPRT